MAAAWMVYQEYFALSSQDRITSFIKAQKLPMLQESDIKTERLHEDVVMFTVGYGEPMDCPSGCFYSRAVGILFRGRAGWLTVDNYDRTADTVNAASYFDFRRTDQALFSEQFADQLISKDEYAHGGLRRLLARDKDTPVSVLERLTANITTEERFDSCLIRDLALNDNLKHAEQAHQRIQALYTAELADDFVVKHLYAAGGFCEEI